MGVSASGEFFTSELTFLTFFFLFYNFILLSGGEQAIIHCGIWVDTKM